ncbi:adenosine receptor A1-like [Montipora foliosa]|uniref:adenosine receptor A1-like n=1 Tax=Montipora foliosa TaxID=591990 RepID=UPI0035F15B66
MVMVKNPLRCFKRVFSVYLAFISATDLFVGLVVCPAQVLVRFLCVFSDRSIPQEGEFVQILSYIGINSSILLVTAVSIDRFVAVIFPHTYRQRMKPKTAVVCNSCIIVFSSIFASLQLINISKDVYIAIDVHLHTTFPLSTTSVAYLGIFYFLKKQSRVVVVQRQATMPSNNSLNDRKRERTAKMEKEIATTSFLILVFLILSLIPYFAVMVVGIHCESCAKKNWFFIVRQSSTVILFLNSMVNPFLASFRINEMKKSCAIVRQVFFGNSAHAVNNR